PPISSTCSVSRFSRARRHALGAVASTVLGSAWLVWHGPFRVLRGNEPIDLNAPFLYMLSAFPFFGVLIADAISAVAHKRLLTTFGPIAACSVLALLRLAIGIPVSGHALLLGYFVVVSWWQLPLWLAHVETVLAILCIAAVGMMKV